MIFSFLSNRCISIIIIITIIIIIITTIAIAPNILFSIDRSMSIWLTICKAFKKKF